MFTETVHGTKFVDFLGCRKLAVILSSAFYCTKNNTIHTNYESCTLH